jgi:hypothetical protein
MKDKNLDQCSGSESGTKSGNRLCGESGIGPDPGLWWPKINLQLKIINWNLFTFFLFLFWFWNRIPNPEPDPQSQLHQDPDPKQWLRLMYSRLPYCSSESVVSQHNGIFIPNFPHPFSNAGAWVWSQIRYRVRQILIFWSSCVSFLL